jgi:hypothetical protein
MKTIIETKELLKILEPSEGVVYKGQKVALDLEQLQNYITNPKKHKVFEAASDIQESFYRNLALYVINSNDNPKCVQIDLNKDNPIESGLFEFVKNIVNEEEITSIELPENGDNLLFIQSKKLKNLSNYPGYEHYFSEVAKDVELGGRTSVFMRTEKVTEKEKFFWTAQENDRYSDTDFLINKLADTVRSIDFSKVSLREEKRDNDKEFFSVLKVSDQKLIKSEAFKLALLNANNKQINQVIIQDNQPKVFSIDFSKDFVRDFILEKVEESDFNLLGEIFKHNANASKKNSYEWVREAVKVGKMTFDTVHKLDFYPIINHPNTIEYLLDQRATELNISGEHDNLTVVSAYQYFSKENKVNPDIVNKFLESITSGYGSDKRMNERQLNRMPVSLYNEEYFLEQVLPYINFPEIKSKLKAWEIEPKLLSDKKFIINNCKNVPAYRFNEWLSNFLPKGDVDKEFLLNIVKVKPNYCETIIGSTSNMLKAFSKDKDIIFTAAKSGFDPTRISSRLFKEYFLDDDNAEDEAVKVKYLIESRDHKSGKDWFKDPEQAKKFEEKYFRPEYMYLAKDEYFYGNDARAKIQKQLKTPGEVLESLKKVKSFPDKYTFRADYFYKELPSNLKSNKKVLDAILDCKGKAFPFKELSENLQYNADVALNFIAKDPNNTPDVPKEFFNDINFSLEFAKLMDRGLFRGKESLIPEFITKFFDNQNIKGDYHQKLEHYVSVFSLKETLDEKPNVQKKRMKI